MPGPPELLIIAVIVLLIFGGSQLPKLARNLGQAQKEFKKGMEDGMKDDTSTKSEAPAKNEGTSETKQ